MMQYAREPTQQSVIFGQFDDNDDSKFVKINFIFKEIESQYDTRGMSHFQAIPR